MLPVASRSIAFALLISAVLVGCGTGPGSIDVSATPTKPTVKVSRIGGIDESGLFLPRGESRVRFGETEERVFSVFAKPSGAVDFFEEPPVEGDEYSSHGWQSGQEGFAAIMVGNRMALGLHTLERAGRETVSDSISSLSADFKPTEPTFVPSGNGTYWFWDKGRVRVMLCTFTDLKGKTSMATAIGDADLMDAMSMNPASARQDLLEASNILESAQEHE